MDLEDSDRWEVLYPASCLELLPVSVRLRDDSEISGVCNTSSRGTLCTSTDFGPFSAAAAQFINDEIAAARTEAALREIRQREMGDALDEHVNRALFLRLKKRGVFHIHHCHEAAPGTHALLYSLGLPRGAPADGCRARPCSDAAVVPHLGGIRLGSVCAQRKQQHFGEIRAARPELEEFESNNLTFSDEDNKDSLLRRFVPVFLGSLVISFSCMAAMTVAFGIGGFGWQMVFLWLYPLVGVCFCCRVGCCQTGLPDDDCYQACCCAMWPGHLLHCCGCRRLAAKLKRPRRQALQRAIFDRNQNTIVFEGNVIPGRNAVSSWPDKYVSAWDILVKRSRQDGISAAVVFLPTGSEDFSVHDKIPKKEAQLLPSHLTRGCWCIPYVRRQESVGVPLVVQIDWEH